MLPADTSSKGKRALAARQPLYMHACSWRWRLLMSGLAGQGAEAAAAGARYLGCDSEPEKNAWVAALQKSLEASKTAGQPAPARFTARVSAPHALNRVVVCAEAG